MWQRHEASRPAGRVPRAARLLALAHRFEQLIAKGVVSDHAELARLGRAMLLPSRGTCFSTPSRPSLSANAIWRFAKDLSSLALMDAEKELAERLEVTNPEAASGGADAETLAQAAGRAVRSLHDTPRAVGFMGLQVSIGSEPGKLARKTW